MAAPLEPNTNRQPVAPHSPLHAYYETDAERTRFVGDLRSVDPDVTGPPVTAFESIRLIRRGYFEGTLYALVVLYLFVLIALFYAFTVAFRGPR